MIVLDATKVEHQNNEPNLIDFQNQDNSSELVSWNFEKSNMNVIDFLVQAAPYVDPMEELNSFSIDHCRPQAKRRYRQTEIKFLNNPFEISTIEEEVTVEDSLLVKQNSNVDFEQELQQNPHVEDTFVFTFSNINQEKYQRINQEFSELFKEGSQSEETSEEIPEENDKQDPNEDTDNVYLHELPAESVAKSMFNQQQISAVGMHMRRSRTI